MGEKAASKNNKTPLDGAWTCKTCGRINGRADAGCTGIMHTRRVQPSGGGWTTSMVHEPCGGTK